MGIPAKRASLGKTTQPAASAKEFFITYDQREAAWAEWIAWQLEANGYPTIIQAGNFVLDRDRALKQARKIILVLSRNCPGSGFTGKEWAAAFASDPAGQEARVIPVRIEDVALKGPLAQIAWVDLVGKDEAAAREALLSHVRTVGAKPSPAHTLPSGTPPEFPGARAQKRAAAALANITVEWPRSPLYSNSMHPIRVALPPGVGWVRIKFEYSQQLLWVSGPGKVPNSSEFVCEFKGLAAAHAIELNLGVRSAPEGGSIEPITAYFFSREERQIAEASGDLELVPKPVPPTVVRSVVQTLLWLIGAEPEKPLLTRALHMAARLALLAAVALGYHYYKTPEPLTHFETDLGLLPPHTIVGPRWNPSDLVQEFPLNGAVAVRKAWKHPAAWTIEPGFMANGKDGKLRLIGLGAGTFPVPEGSALYDFHMTFAVELPPQGTAVWIIRAQPDSGSSDPGVVRGYHFTLTNRGTEVYFTASAVGAPARIIGTTSYRFPVADERPLQLGASCCTPQDRIRVQIEAQGFKLNHSFNLQELVPGSHDIEHPWDAVEIEDLRGAFRFGAFLIVGTAPGPGPAYEFIRLQDAS